MGRVASNPIITLFVKPGNGEFDGWGLSFGAWDNPDHFVLEGFESSFDAWAFCFVHYGIDLTAGDKDNNRKWTNRPKDKSKSASQPRLL
jgi:hypothetical protein